MEKDLNDIRIKYENFEDVFNHDHAVDGVTLTEPEVLIATPPSPSPSPSPGSGGGGGFKRNYAASLDESRKQEPQRRFDCAGMSSMTPEDYIHPIAHKRYRRGELNPIFTPPFFEILENPTAPIDVVTARCHSCNVVLRGHKNVTSNFIKHMKRAHPEVAQVYEGIKMSKMRNINMKADYIRQLMERNGNNSNNITIAARSGDFMEQLSNGQSQMSSSEIMGDGIQTPETICNSTTPSNNSLETTETERNTDGNVTNFPETVMCFPSMTNATAISDERPHLKTQKEQLFPSEMLEAIGHLLDVKLKSFVTKKEFYEAQKTTGITTGSVSMSEEHNTTDENGFNDDNDNNAVQSDTKNCGEKSNDLAIQLHTLRKQNLEMRNAMHQLQHSKCQLQRQLQDLDGRLRRHKLIIRNVPIIDQQTPQQAAEDIIQKQLELSDVIVIFADKLSDNRSHSHCPSSRGGNMQSSTTTQHLYVELRNERDTALVLRQSNKLHQIGLRIERFQSRAALQRRNKLLVLRKELHRRCPSLKVYVRDMTLFVNTSEFYWGDGDGLCLGKVDNSSTDLDVCACLQRLTGHDFKEFLYVLQNYDVHIRQ